MCRMYQLSARHVSSLKKRAFDQWKCAEPPRQIDSETATEMTLSEHGEQGTLPRVGSHFISENLHHSVLHPYPQAPQLAGAPSMRWNPPRGSSPGLGDFF